MKALLIAVGLLLTGCASVDSAGPFSVTSPNEEVVFNFSLSDTTAHYSIDYDGALVLQPSELGVVLGEENFHSGLTLAKVGPIKTVTDSYQLRHGKQTAINYKANERAFTLRNTKGERMVVRVRVSNDGAAFRYEFRGHSGTPVTVEQEFTQFAFAPSAKGWLQPVAVAKTGWKRTNPSYEEHYLMGIPVGTPEPTGAGWVFPALFNSGEHWVAITEAGMTGEYHASRLSPDSADGVYQIGYPMPAEVFTGRALKANAKLPFKSPWRIIAVGDLATVTESTLGTDLAEPAVAKMPFAEPGLVSWSWALLKDDSVNYETQRVFIDYAAQMGWSYNLVDVGWDTRIGEDKVRELADYASSKGVGLILWYNSAGDWNDTPYTPKGALLEREARRAEFAKLQAWGIRGVKIDFFAGDGQSVIDYYIDLLEDAADFDLMVNCHGSTLPRGLQRTYPNLMTMEAVHGFEMITFFQESADAAPAQATVLPFTRNLFDPMDYTPTTFGEIIPDRNRKSTNGFELALPVLFTSGLQHIAETASRMQQVPESIRAIMKNIPVAWDETRLVSGYPGKDVVIARRHGSRWYVAGINGEDTAKTFNLDLSFISASSGDIFTDGNARFSFANRKVTPEENTVTKVKAYGGFLMIFDAE